MEMCGLFPVLTSQSTLPIATLAFDFRSGEGRGNISTPSSLCFQENMDERLAGRIGYFTVMDGSEAGGDLVLIQTLFALKIVLEKY